MSGRCLAVLPLLLLAVGCDPSLPDPVVRSVEPASIEEGHPAKLRITFDAVLPFSVDYGHDLATLQPELALRVGEVPLALSGPPSEGAVTGILPFDLAPGAYDVSLSLADGRRAVLPAGFEVTPGRFPESFTLDPIPEQRRGVSFDVTLRGEGGQAAAFTGVARLKVNRGSISPEITGAFENGVRTERVTLSAPAPDVVITVEDAAGHTGSSAPFRVRP